MVVVFFLLMTTMTVFAVDRLGTSDAAAGFVASAFVIGSVATRVVSGAFVERIGRRRSLLGALVLFIVGCAMHLFPMGFIGLVALRIVHGATFAIGTTAVMTIAQSKIPHSRRAEGTGYFTLSTTGATAIGPFLMLALIKDGGYDRIFLTCLALAVTALALALMLGRSAPGRTRVALVGGRITNLIEPSLLPLGAFILTIGMSFAAVVTFTNPFAIEENLVSEAGGFFLAYAAGAVGARLFVGRIQDRHGDRVVVVPAVVLMAVSLLMLSQANNTAILLGSGILLGVGWGTLMAATQAIAVANAPPHRLGIAISTYYLLLDTGTILGPIVLGLVADSYGFRSMFFGVGLLVMASLALFGVGQARTT